jgi:hypothetical protein
VRATVSGLVTICICSDRCYIQYSLHISEFDCGKGFIYFASLIVVVAKAKGVGVFGGGEGGLDLRLIFTN